MKCEDVQNIIISYQEGGLPPEETRQVEQHLKQCRACEREASALMKTWNLMDEWRDIEPSADFEEKFWQKAKPERWFDRVIRLFTFKIPAWATMALLLLSFTTGHFVNTADKPQPPEKTRVVYLPVTDQYLTQNVKTPGRTTTSIPRPDRIFNATETEPVTTLEDYTFSEEPGEGFILQRIDIDSVFDTAGS